MPDKAFNLSELIKRCQKEGKSKICFLNDALGPDCPCKYQGEKKTKNYIDKEGTPQFEIYHDCLKEQKCQ